MTQTAKRTLPRYFAKLWQYIRFGWPTMALVASVAFGGYVLMLDTARDQDNVYVQSTRDFVRESTAELVRSTASVSSDYALWSDAYDNITVKNDQNWIESNYFSTNVTTLSVFRPQIGLSYSFVKDDDEKLRATLPQILPSLDVDVFRDYSENPSEGNITAPATQLVVINNGLYTLAYQPIRPYEDYKGKKPVKGDVINYAVVMTAIDQKAINGLGKAFALSNPRLTIGDKPKSNNNSLVHFAIKDPNLKTLAIVSWDNLRPGTKAMNARLIPVFSALLLIMVLTIIVMQRSVSARMQLFKEAREAAETANRVKSNFLASVSHELRTPLSGIIGYAEMIEEDANEAGNAVTARDAKKVTNSAHHLLSVINDLLDHTKIEAGKMDLNPTKVEVTPILKSVIDNLQHQVTKKNTKLTLSVDADLGEAVIDGMRLKQCLFNLVSNAAKFTSNGTILVSARPVDNAGRPFIRIAVKDSGIGMSEETVSKLFKPFTQADEGISAKFGGTGLGLVITRALIEAMGGSVSVESAYGEGSTFTILVPRGVAWSSLSQTGSIETPIAA